MHVVTQRGTSTGLGITTSILQAHNDLNTLAMIYNWDIQSLGTLYNSLYTYTFCYILK